MKEATPKTIHLKDYTPTVFDIDTVFLTFDLDPKKTIVENRMSVKRNPKSENKSTELRLDGEGLELLEVKIDDNVLDSSVYTYDKDILTITGCPDSFELTLKNSVNPEANKALDGLYKSGKIYCTQNEPEGFRRITFYLDRPDVMARFSTKVIAHKAQYPVLLSNGNPIDSGDLDDGKHFVTWEDPFPKPCYLYALVAGDLGLVSDTYKTMSGRTIDLRIYCDKGNESKCNHAMESLKNSMKWDEDTFGLEYDLDIYMIVAVDSFNMGAMENKGLNIFNSVYVLADEKSATDDNFLGIESVVGHEYFHNWTGNRITCRDWFQLTLKEGLTVFRDQEFSSDLNSRPVVRIADVNRLRSFQFPEDAGPTAHPIRPDSYIEINNFYTATVYEKGAEVIRMVHTMLGVDGFRAGMDKYFELYDGQAVTTEDFLHAMSVANNNFDFTQFKNWYFQAGTPKIKASWIYDDSSKSVTLKISQESIKNKDNFNAYHFPLALGILNSKGEDVSLKLKGDSKQSQLSDGILHITKEDEEFVFTNIEDFKTVSLNRGFSAPINLDVEYSMQDLYFLMANDNDLFNQYESLHRASLRIMRDLINKTELTLEEDFYQAFGEILKNDKLDAAVKAQILTLPSETIIKQGLKNLDFLAMNKVRSFVKKSLGQRFETELIEIYETTKITDTEYKLDPESVGRRSLSGVALEYLCPLKKDNTNELIKDHYKNAKNMTEELKGLSLISHMDEKSFEAASEKFYKKWKEQTLVMQKWLLINASSSLESTYERVQKLESNSVYDVNIPNLVRSLVGGVGRNVSQFYHESGRGFSYMADKIIELDKINPQVASRLAGMFKDYKNLEQTAQNLMGKELKRILDTKDLSKNVFEIVSKTYNS